MEAKKSNRANLENKKILFFELGLICALTMTLVAFEWTSEVRKTDLSKLLIKENIIQEDAIVTLKKEVEMPKPKPITHLFTVVKNNTKDIPDIPIFPNDEDDDNKIIGTPTLLPTVEDNVEDISSKIFEIVEEYPSFNGGDAEYYKYLSENVKYPQIAKESNISGIVYVSFIIEKDGSISNVNLVKGIGGGCDEVAIETIKKMPKWNPGKQRTKAVRTKLVLPIKFSLL